MDVLRLLNVTDGVGGVAMKTIIIPIALLTLVAVQGNANAANNNTQRHSQSATNAIPVTQAPLLHGAVRHHTTLASNRYAQNKRYTKQRVRYAGRVFIFDPRRHRWYAYSNGRLIASGVAAGGAGYCRDIKRSCRTPVGHFRISRKGGANCRSGTYPKPRGGARMDYCMFFSKYYAIHGSNSVPAANVSHGCIRVKPAAARWLHRNFLSIGTKVIVRSY